MVRSAVETLFPGKVRSEQPAKAVAQGAALAAAVEYNEVVRKAIEETGGRIDDEGKIELSEDVDIDIEGSSFTAENPPELIAVPQVLAGGGDSFSDKLSRSFGPGVLFGTPDGKTEYMIDNLLFEGDAAPSEAVKVYGSAMENQPSAHLRIFENVATDREDTRVTPSVDREGNEQYTDPALKVKKIGELTLSLPPNTPVGMEIVEVAFHSDTMGLSVSAKNTQTGETVNTVIDFATVMSDEEAAAAKQRMAEIKTTGQLIP
jgi:molecular chaperone DnaK (HSP70)